MSPQAVAALGAFCTGLASLITALVAISAQKRKGDDECARRIEEIKDAFYRGWQLKTEVEEEDDRWSGLP